MIESKSDNETESKINRMKKKQQQQGDEEEKQFYAPVFRVYAAGEEKERKKNETKNKISSMNMTLNERRQRWQPQHERNGSVVAPIRTLFRILN